MKKIHILLEFAVVFTLLVLPAILTAPDATRAVGAAPLPLTAAEAIVALALERRNRRAHHAPPTLARLVTGISWGSITLGILMVAYALVTAASLLAPATAGSAPYIAPPAGVAGTVRLVAALAVGAYYEEALYRQFLPDALAELAEGGRPRAAAEAVCVVLFALGHRYLGWPAVANAVLCGTALRLCAIRTGGIYAGAAAHLAYNLMLFCFAMLSSK